MNEIYGVYTTADIVLGSLICKGETNITAEDLNVYQILRALSGEDGVFALKKRLVAKQLGLTERNLRKQLHRMTGLGLLEVIGRDKRGVSAFVVVPPAEVVDTILTN